MSIETLDVVLHLSLSQDNILYLLNNSYKTYKIIKCQKISLKLVELY